MYKEEIDILLSFRDGKFIESKKEMDVLKRYSFTGMIKFGVDVENRKPQAILTRRGKWFAGVAK
ncbi:MAG: hypothetical protein ACOC5T_00455 [Elusimicrobiota bacterium]